MAHATTPPPTSSPAARQGQTDAPETPDHLDKPLCVHGNPNVLTADVPSSRLSQGCTGQHALVQVERYAGDPPPVTVTAPPELLRKEEL